MSRRRLQLGLCVSSVALIAAWVLFEDSEPQGVDALGRGAPSVQAPEPSQGRLGELDVDQGSDRRAAPLVEEHNDAFDLPAGTPDPSANGPEDVERWPFAARVVDARDGAPIPHLRLRVFMVGEPCFVETGADGAFLSADSYPEGTYWIAPAEAAYLDPVSFEHEAPAEGAGLAELELSTGPTFWLEPRDLPAGVGTEDLVAGLLQGEDLDSAYAGRTDFYPVHGPRKGSGPGTLDTLPWIRFGDDDVETVGTAGPWTVLVGNRDGRWLGAAKAPGIHGRFPDPLPVRLFETSAVYGTVRDQGGTPRSEVRLGLVRDSERQEDWPTATSRSLEDGSFRFPFIQPGSYTLAVSRFQDLAAEPQTVVVTSVAESVQVDVVVSELAPGGTVQGLVRSRSGSFHGDTSVLVRPYVGVSTRVQWTEENDEWLGAFAIEDVPVGTYRLDVTAHGFKYRISVSHESFASPTSALEVMIHDDVPAHDLAFRARDADTGAPLEEFSYHFQFDSPAGGRYRSGDHGTPTVGVTVPEDLAFEWILEAKGHAPAYGTDADFVATSDSLREAEAVLEPGWGARIEFFTWNEDGGYSDGIPGIELLMDGVALGRSGPDGRISVHLPARPGRLSIRSDAWELDPGGNVDPATGRFDDSGKLPLSVAVRRRAPR